MRATVYTRANCGLCEEATRLLQQHGFELTFVDIDGDAELQRRFTTCVPVVEIDGRVRFRGRVNEILLRRMLHEAP